MTNALKRGCFTCGLLLAFSTFAFADVYAVGYLAYDNTGTHAPDYQFDVANLTGPNELAPTFPISTSLDLSSLSLTVHFDNGSTVVEPSTYFSLDADGISWDGSVIPTGGANPNPVSATLTGSFVETSINVDGVGTVSISPTFSVTLSDSPILAAGDLAVIYATSTTTSPVPEISSWGLMASIIGFIGLARSRKMRETLRKASGTMRSSALPLALVCACAFLIPAAHAASPTLSSITSPSSGVAGTNNVNVTANNWPSGDTTAANIMVLWESSCGGAAVATDAANTLHNVLGPVYRVNVNIPSGLSTGTYYLQLMDSAAGDTDFTSANCSTVQVTGSSKTLASCVPASSLGVVAPVTGPAPVYSIVPSGSWCCSRSTGVQVRQVETGGGPVVPPAPVALPDYINSCAGNPATNEAVCVANNTHVYHLKNIGTTNTFTSLTSGATTTTGFSGGSCSNCGVAVSSAGNFAVITEGLSGSPSRSGLQTLNLATDTFLAPVPLAQEVSENIAIDPTRGLVLSANESNHFNLIAIDGAGNIGTEYDKANTYFGELDSTAIDCSTGIALAPYEFSYSEITMEDLTQAVFTPGTPGSYTAPTSYTDLSAATGLAAGASGAAVAPGGNHLAVVTGEFGGSAFIVVQMPATSGTGTPAVADYAYVCSVTGFSAGYDPHTLTAYVSPNNGKSYALFANWNTFPISLLQADMAGILKLPRAGDGHTIVGDGGGCGLDPAGTVGSTVLANH